MAHMVPDYTKEDFYIVETSHGTECVPVKLAGNKAAVAAFIEPNATVTSLELVKGKWFARLSTRGYLDCTEWCGPFASKAAAELYIEATFECHPITGEEQ